MATRLTDVRAFPRSGVDLDDDKSLVLAFQSGDIDAYSDIFVKYRALSAQICYRILQDHEEADEAVQETMLRVYRGLGRFNGRYQLQAWVARIATNVALDMVRARARRPQHDPARHDISEDTGLILALTDDTSEAVERVLDREEIRSILSSIPDHHREALVLREFEGRSHQEIGDALGVSPQQAKALIHRAKKSFRRVWNQGGERRGVAALAPILLAPFKLPAFLRKLAQPAHDAVASASATAQQVAAQVTASPAIAQSTVSVADKVTAVAITVLVAGTVGVGAVAIRHSQKPSKPTPVTASSPAPAPPVGVIVTPPVRSKSAAKPDHKPQHKPDHQTQGGGQGQTGAVPGETPESPAPTEPSPTTVPEGPPPPPPPAPAWTGAFETSGGIQAADLALVSQRVTGQHSDQRYFSQVVQGDLVDGDGKPIGTVYLDFGGSITGNDGSLSSLWLWVDTPEGQYRYAAGGHLTAATLGEDDSTTYVFSGGFSLSSVPEVLETEVPHDGTISISLGFWGDGSLYATSVSMDEA